MSTDITLVGLRIDGVELDIQTLVDLQTDARSDLEDIFPRLAEAENRGANNRWRIENIEIGIALLPTLIATSIGESSAILEGSIESVELALAAARAEAEAARLLAERTERRYNETRTYIDDTSFAARQEIQNRFQNDLFELQDGFDASIFDLEESVNIDIINANTRIDTRKTEIINETSARAEMVNALEATYFTDTQQVKAESLTSYYTAVAADQAIANSVSDLRSTFIGPDDQIKASVLTGYYTKAGTDSALSGVQEVLNSEIVGNKTDAETLVNAVSANLTNNYYTKVSTDSAIAASQTTLQASIDGVSANIEENYQTKVESGSAISALQITLQSEIETVATDKVTQAANIINSNLTTNYYTSAETDGAISASQTTLQANITSTDIATTAAQNAADAASALANTKGKVLVQSATPAAADRLSQNLWIDITSGNNTPKRWTGSSWAAVTDKAATDAAAAAAAALLAANSISATLTNDYYTKVSTDQAISSAETRLSADIGEVSASVTTQGSAIVDLQEGQAAGSSVAGYLIKAQAGGAVSLIDLVASNDGVTEAYSIIKIAADDIILEGSVTADSLGVGSVIADKIGVGEVTAEKINVGSLSAISATIGTLSSAPSGERVVIQDDRISVFDNNNALRVRIGRL